LSPLFEEELAGKIHRKSIVYNSILTIIKIIRFRIFDTRNNITDQQCTFNNQTQSLLCRFCCSVEYNIMQKKKKILFFSPHQTSSGDW
jgi:hypothetical protein